MINIRSLPINRSTCCPQLSHNNSQAHHIVVMGLRSICSVLNYAGTLKRDNAKKEEHLLIQALTASNAPSEFDVSLTDRVLMEIPEFLLPDDLPLFYGTMQDLFPKVLIGTSVDDGTTSDDRRYTSSTPLGIGRVPDRLHEIIVPDD
ncbi:hypothetical protein PROFUN_12123 [Planoprotostelium fungivorum]|uniref:Dynein heavy chain hydrolytic ATP-binding dynein motor region domain-containing protein n=1 Tax=Planoprotostelium fungivorum TaxID=1890364 RepID=A0A2P6N896_9EUKA|nr:hypothetical protein PROFUN_12123 [Planoprotostelium fungivorum]